MNETGERGRGEREREREREGGREKRRRERRRERGERDVYIYICKLTMRNVNEAAERWMCESAGAEGGVSAEWSE